MLVFTGAGHLPHSPPTIPVTVVRLQPRANFMTRLARPRLLLVTVALAVVWSIPARADKPRSEKSRPDKSRTSDKAYPFRLTPAEALARLQALGAPAPAKDELKLFARAADGKTPDDDTFADACLIASGVLDPAKRKDYRARLDRITADA